MHKKFLKISALALISCTSLGGITGISEARADDYTLTMWGPCTANASITGRSLARGIPQKQKCEELGSFISARAKQGKTTSIDKKCPPGPAVVDGLPSFGPAFWPTSYVCEKTTVAKEQNPLAPQWGEKKGEGKDDEDW